MRGGKKAKTNTIISAHNTVVDESWNARKEQIKNVYVRSKLFIHVVKFQPK